jgi:hypothetical protein
MINTASFYSYLPYSEPQLTDFYHAMGEMVDNNPCPDPQPYEQQKTGWLQFHWSEGESILTHHTKRKVVDSATVKCEVERRLSLIKLNGGEINKKLRNETKETVIEEMLPHLPFRDEYIKIYFNKGVMVVGASMKKADEIISSLNEHGFGLNIKLLEPEFDINLLKNIIEYTGEHDDRYLPTGSFSYHDSITMEDITVTNKDEDTPSCEWSAIDIDSVNYDIKWFGLHEAGGDTMKLMADGTLKSIKLAIEVDDMDPIVALRYHFLLIKNHYLNILNLLNSFKR